jgi:pilus assembly protein CpaE
MTRQWIGYTADESREELERALAQVSPRAHLVFARDAADIRCRLRDEEPRTVGAIVGLTTDGVSDVNLAAALAADRRASEVVLVARFVTGSLRSRAAQAGISRVIDIDDVLFDDLAEVGDGSVQHTETPARDDGMQDGGVQGPVIVFASGRGGVGKTALVAIAAALAGHWGLRVGVVDLDLACGNLPSCFGVGRWTDPTSYMESGELLRQDALEAGVNACEGTTLWGPCRRPELAEQAMPAAGPLLATLSGACDLVLVDTSSTCTDAVAQAMQAADRLVLVHDDGPGSIAFLARVSALAVRLGVARTRIVRVENGCLPRKVGAPFTPLVETGLESARAYRVPDGGDEIRELLAEGKADELRELGGDFVRGVASLLASLLQELGSLPDNDEARRAAELPRRRRLQLFGRKKEVA